MGDALELHTVARRHLVERRSFWIGEYSKLPNHGRAADGYHYLEQAKDTFPRYNVLEAIRIEVERLDPDRLPSADEVATHLRRAAFDAASVMTAPPHGEIEARAMDDERARFAAWLDALVVPDLDPEPLPYRRVLADEEVRSWSVLVEGRWPIEDGGWWRPITERAESDDALALVDACFWAGNDLGPATRAVRRALGSLGIDRVVELREHGPSYETDVPGLLPTYDGAEAMFTSVGAEWLLFASHEGAAALGGTIVVPFKRAFPAWSDARWTGSWE